MWSHASVGRRFRSSASERVKAQLLHGAAYKRSEDTTERGTYTKVRAREVLDGAHLMRVEEEEEEEEEEYGHRRESETSCCDWKDQRRATGRKHKDLEHKSSELN